MKFCAMNILAALIALLAIHSSRAADAPATTQANTPSSTQPTRVSLHLNHAPATQAIVKLFDQAHIPTATILNPHLADRLADINVTCDVTDRPFTIAMLDIFHQCGIEPDQAPAPGQPTGFNIRP